MKNNKGFSVVELIVSFGLTMLVMVILFEIIISMKNLYEKSIIQAELVNKQNTMTDYIYTDLYDNKLSSVSYCGETCIEFNYLNKENEPITKSLVWNQDTLTYGDYSVALIHNSKFGDVVFNLGNEVYTTSGINSYFSIQIPIIHSLFPEENFGINLFYTYNSGTVDVNN